MQAKKAKEPDSDSVSDSGFSLLTKYNVYKSIYVLRGGVKNMTDRRKTIMEWRQIPGWEDYFVRQDGIVKSKKAYLNKRKRTFKTKETILKSFLNAHGYLCVNLVEGRVGKRIQARVHCLVASAFIGERPENCDIMHLDGDKTNPALQNLRYGSRKCNEAFKIDHGTSLEGERHHQAKLKEKDVIEIRKQLENGIAGVVLAKKYNITPSAICAINRGRSWASV